MGKKIALITVNYNREENQNDLIKDLRNQSDGDYELYIVDTSSEEQHFDTSEHVHIVPSHNHGYAAGLNKGIRRAIEHGHTLFVFMNNDVHVKKTFIATIRKSLTSYPKTLIGGKIYYAPGYEYHKERYSHGQLGHVIWYAGGIIDWDHAYPKHIGVDQVDDGSFNNPLGTEFITGCFMAFDKDLFDSLGEMNETYFLYYEDAEWCARARKKGLSIMYDPSIELWHKVSSSTGGQGSKLHEKYQKRNRVKFGLVYAPFRTKIHLLLNYFTK